MSVIGRFYYKQTRNGNLIGEFSNNHTDENLPESCHIESRFDKNHPFIGEYTTCWFENTARALNLKIDYRAGNQEIYKLIWSKRTGDNDIVYFGEGFIVDDILIGDYRDFK